MVQLYIHQNIEVAGKYKVYDEKQEMIYWLQAKPYQIGAKIKMVDASNDKIIYKIKEKSKWSLNRTFEVFGENEQLICTVKTKSSLKFKIEIEMNELDSGGEAQKYQVKCDLLSFTFKLYNDNLQIGSIEKKLAFGYNAYTLDMADSFNPALFSAIVSIIDTLINRNKNSGLGSGI